MSSPAPSAFALTEAAINDVASIADPKSMSRVYEEYAKLNEVVDQLGMKVSGVLAKQENEFLGAYRAHMYNVQRELQGLKAEVVEKENALTNNEQMQKLEEECKWYREESLRLDGLLGEAKKSEQFMKQKMVMLEDDRNWLAKQLKSAKKQNKLLRAEIELQLREGIDANDKMFETREPETGGMSDAQNMSSLPALPRPGSKSTGRMFQSQSASVLLPTDTLLLQKELRQMKTQRDAEKKTAQALRASITEEKTSRKELEEFFLDCIEDVKKSIERRRRKAALGGKMTAIQEALLQKPIELHDFMAQDRKVVVESLLSRDEVLSILFDSLFPAASVGKMNNNNQPQVSDDDDLGALLGKTGINA